MEEAKVKRKFICILLSMSFIMRGCFKNEKELPQFIIGYDDYCPFNYINDQVKQDGTITCKSTKDVGTTFLVESTFR